jgi:hypothetical protein
MNAASIDNLGRKLHNVRFCDTAAFRCAEEFVRYWAVSNIE